MNSFNSQEKPKKVKKIKRSQSGNLKTPLKSHKS